MSLDRPTTPSVDESAAIEAENLTRRFGRATALDGVSLQIQRGEFFSLLGPSGCGKTTLLRLIAGLDFPDAGSLKILGRDAVNWPAHQRPVNTVFQSYALFPHLNVWDNIAFGLRMKKVIAREIETRVRRIMEIVAISELGQRRTSEISGGQKQRVALARAVVNEPQILLLDEPLGALDLKLRKQLQVELHQLQRRLGITFIYVTHDQEEALTMSDRIAVMDRGKIAQIDSPAKLYENPRTRFVAQFLGSCNLVEGQIREVAAERIRVATALGNLIVQARVDGNGVVRRAGDKVTLAIRPEKISLLESATAAQPNQVKAKIEDLIYSGAETQYLLRAGEVSLRGTMFNSGLVPPFAVGEELVLQFPPEALIALDD